MFRVRIELLPLLLISTHIPLSSSPQIPDSEPGMVANIPVNHVEAQAGSYILPDPLRRNNGSQV